MIVERFCATLDSVGRPHLGNPRLTIWRKTKYGGVVNRPLFVGAIGAVIVGAAFALTTFFDFQPGARPQGGAPASVPADVARSGPPTPASSPERAPADSASKLAAPEISKKPIRPSFDVVGDNRVGDAVFGGRAAPNAEFTVT